jgi:hypothetical protein
VLSWGLGRSVSDPSEVRANHCSVGCGVERAVYTAQFNQSRSFYQRTPVCHPNYIQELGIVNPVLSLPNTPSFGTPKTPPVSNIGCSTTYGRTEYKDGSIKCISPFLCGSGFSTLSFRSVFLLSLFFQARAIG